MKAQSGEHVGRCKSATTPRSQCRCRCGGKCHGRKLDAQGAGRAYFEALPQDDPHHLQTEAERRAARRSDGQQRRELRRREKLNRGRRGFIEDVRRRNPERAAELEAQWFGAAA